LNNLIVPYRGKKEKTPIFKTSKTRRFNVYESTKVLLNEKICDGVYSMVLHAPQIAAAAAPGQFVMLKVREGNEPFLMRPFSINTVDVKQGTVTLLYKVVGDGTRQMAALRGGDVLQMLGPLGNGFPTPSVRYAALVGRGIGIAPMRFLAEELIRQGTKVYVYLSAKNEAFLFHRDLFAQLGAVVKTTTDPTVRVTSFLERDAKTIPFDIAYSCGSHRLAQDLKGLHDSIGLAAYVSLEEHMACGIGACKGCAHTAYDPQTGKTFYVRVCKEGPVFPVERVVE